MLLPSIMKVLVIEKALQLSLSSLNYRYMARKIFNPISGFISFFVYVVVTAYIFAKLSAPIFKANESSNK